MSFLPGNGRAKSLVCVLAWAHFLVWEVCDTTCTIICTRRFSQSILIEQTQLMLKLVRAGGMIVPTTSLAYP